MAKWYNVSVEAKETVAKDVRYSCVVDSEEKAREIAKQIKETKSVNPILDQDVLEKIECDAVVVETRVITPTIEINVKEAEKPEDALWAFTEEDGVEKLVLELDEE